MRRFRLPFLLAWLCGSTVLPARAAGNCWVITRNGNRVTGVALTAAPDGTLRLQMQARGPVQRFRPGTYRAAYIPEPRQVKLLAQMAEQKQYAQVLKYAPGLFDRYKFLGWGDAIAAFQASALLETGKPKDALKVIDAARQYIVFNGDELLKVKIRALLKLGKKADALAELKRLAGSPKKEMAAFAFNLRGDLLAEEGKKKDAVLQYLKTVLLFRPGQLDAERNYARKKVVGLLKELKDPRYKEFEKLR